MSCLQGHIIPPDDPTYHCDEDHVCDPDENQIVCPGDCFYVDETALRDTACVRDVAPEVCDAHENWTFAEECLQSCGNGVPDDRESSATCPRDFPESTACGDGLCHGDESPTRCPADCWLAAEIGAPDGVCDAHENASLCAPDCPASCGDGLCTFDEKSAGACPRDCDTCSGDACVCGDGICGAQESMLSCPDDCSAAACGNGVLEAGEACDDGNQIDTDACTHQCQPATCGDGILHTGVEECDDGNQVPTDACVNCEPATCGDGVVWADNEVCDDGNQSNTDACTKACEPAACGDGHVFAGEEACDDGNLDPGDACTEVCELAVCGDGRVQTGVEECDDGDLDDADACSDDCERPRVVFVTSQDYKGNLGGLAGADATCRALATSAGLERPETFMAWLSDGMSAPKTRFPAAAVDTRFKGRYVLVTGSTVVEDGWDDLTDGTLLVPINFTETSVLRTAKVWTNTDPQGAAAGPDHCAGWSTADVNTDGAQGNNSQVDADWTESLTVGACSNASPLLCFEQ